MRMCNLPGRITKAAARELWKQSKPFVVVPVKLRPYEADGFLTESAFLVTSEMMPYYPSFDVFCATFIHFYCNPETGRYPAFYIKLTERNM